MFIYVYIYICIYTHIFIYLHIPSTYIYVNIDVCIYTRHTSTHSNTLQHTAPHCNTLQHAATHCNTLHHTAPHCTTLHRTATNTTTDTATDTATHLRSGQFRPKIGLWESVAYAAYVQNVLHMWLLVCVAYVDDMQKMCCIWDRCAAYGIDVLHMG